MLCYLLTYQDIFDDQKNIEFCEGIPVKLCLTENVVLLILGDLMSQVDDRVENIFAKLSYHKSVSVLFLTPNLFFKGNMLEQL